MEPTKTAPSRKSMVYICSLQNTIFVSDIAAGTIKLVSGLTGTVSFRHNLGCLYDSFGIGAQTINAVPLSLQEAVQMFHL